MSNVIRFPGSKRYQAKSFGIDRFVSVTITPFIAEPVISKTGFTFRILPPKLEVVK